MLRFLTALYSAPDDSGKDIEEQVLVNLTSFKYASSSAEGGSVLHFEDEDIHVKESQEYIYHLTNVPAPEQEPSGGRVRHGV